MSRCNIRNLLLWLICCGCGPTLLVDAVVVIVVVVLLVALLVEGVGVVYLGSDNNVNNNSGLYTVKPFSSLSHERMISLLLVLPIHF